MSLKIYGDAFWISPYFFSTYVALREKKVEFEVVPVALHLHEQRTIAFRAASGTGRVPMLDHDGFTITESSAIVEYVDETFAGAPLLPKAPKDRARARQIMAWLRSDLMALREERPTNTMFYSRATSELSVGGKEARDNLIRVTRDLLPASGPHLFGEWSIVDSELSWMLHRLILNGENIDENVRQYAVHQWQRPSVLEFVETPRAAYVPY